MINRFSAISLLCAEGKYLYRGGGGAGWQRVIGVIGVFSVARIARVSSEVTLEGADVDGGKG